MAPLKESVEEEERSLYQEERRQELLQAAVREDRAAQVQPEPVA